VFRSSEQRAPEARSDKMAQFVDAKLAHQLDGASECAAAPADGGRSGAEHEGIDGAKTSDLSAARLELKCNGVPEMSSNGKADNAYRSMWYLVLDLGREIVDQHGGRIAIYHVTRPAGVLDRLQFDDAGKSRREGPGDATTCTGQKDHRRRCVAHSIC